MHIIQLNLSTLIDSHFSERHLADLVMNLRCMASPAFKRNQQLYCW